MPTAGEYLKYLTPELYRRFRKAVEIGKWPDGNALSEQQLAICMQAIIAYEQKYVPKTERTGYVPKKQTACHEKMHDETDQNMANASKQPLKWQ